MRIIQIVLIVVLLFAPFFAFADMGSEGVNADFVPQPAMLKPYNDVDLSGKNELEFSWSPYEGSRMDRQYYEFKLYKGYQTVEKTLIFEKEVDPNFSGIKIDAGMFEIGQVYTWTLRQAYNSIRKSQKSHAIFKVIKRGVLMKITSPSFENSKPIPAKFTCDAENVNPSLNIEGIPSNAKSLALIVDDPDAPVGIWIHWVVYDMPVSPIIKENSVPGTLGITSSGKTNYSGPCPPSGVHRYFFKIYALDKKLNLPQGISKADLLKVMQGHILGEAELVGLYKRK
jgi:hypothetical protein